MEGMKNVIESSVRYLDMTRVLGLIDTCREMALVLQVTEPKCI